MSYLLKEYREKRNITLEELSELCDISWRNLIRIENGKEDVAQFKTIAKLLVALEVEDDVILKYIKSFAKEKEK